MKKLMALFLALTLIVGAVPAMATDIANESPLDGGPSALYPALVNSQNPFANMLRPTRGANDRWGYIDSAGRWAIPPTFTDADKFMEFGYAIVSNDNGRYLMDTTGKLVLPIGNYYVLDVKMGNVILYDYDYGTAVISLSGRVILPFDAHSKASFLENGKFIHVAADDFLDYDETQPNPVGDKIIDGNGRDVYPFGKYTGIEYLGGNMAMFYTGKFSQGKNDTSGRSGGVLVNLALGKTYKLPAVYQKRAINVSPFAANGLARVAFTEFRTNSSAKGFYAFMNKTGKIVIADQPYLYCTDFLSNGYYYTYYEEGRNFSLVMRNSKGAQVKKVGNRGLEMSQNNKIIATTGSDTTNVTIAYLTMDLKAIALPKGIKSSQLLGDYIVFNIPAKNAEGKDTYHYGVINSAGKIIIPATQEGTFRLSEGYLVQRSESKDRLTNIEKFYNSAGLLLFTKDSKLGYGNRTPVIQGNRIAYLPLTAVGTSVAPIRAGAPVSAKPSSTKLSVNGNVVALEAYEIAGNNYIKIRDLAAVLNGSEKQFEIGFDMAKNAISATSNTPYTANGSELKLGDGKVKSAATGTSPLFFNGEYVRLGVYTIANSNYYKLRDVMKLINVYVGYDEAKATATLTTATDYDMFEGGIAWVSPADAPDMVWDVESASEAVGGVVRLLQGENKPSQNFIFQPAGGKYRIIAAHSGKALTAKGAGAGMTQANASTDAAQLFTVQRKADGKYNVISSDGLYLTSVGGVKLTLSGKSDQSAQDFIIKQK